MGKESDLLDAARAGDAATVERILSSRTKSKGFSGFASLRKGIGPNIQDANGDTPLHIASLNGHKDTVETLLRLDASANVMDNKGCYPLHLAAWTGNHDICNTLLTLGPSIAQVNEQNSEGDTALHYACQYGHTQTVDVLLQNRADLRLRNKRNESPLDLAAQYGHLGSVKLVLLHDGSVVKEITQSHSPLHLAARNGHKSIVKELIDAGFDINTTTETGSALHEAVLYGKHEVIKVLLRHEIDAELTDCDGHTAVHNSEQHKSERSLEIKRLVEEYIAQKRIPILDRMTMGQQLLDSYDLPSPLKPTPADWTLAADTNGKTGEYGDVEGRAPPPDTSPPDVPKPATRRSEVRTSIYDVPVNVIPVDDQGSPKPLKGYVLLSPNSPSRSPEIPKKPPRKKLPQHIKQPATTTDSPPPAEDSPRSSPKPSTLELDSKRESLPPPQSPTGYQQPPTPDFPPPSPQSAVMGIQEKINPNDKRRSQNMETSTETPITPDSLEQSVPSDKSSGSLADTERSSDLSPLDSDQSVPSISQESETYDNVEPVLSNTEDDLCNKTESLSVDKDGVTLEADERTENNNECEKRNLNPFLGLIKGSNPKGTRRVASQLYETTTPQLIHRQGPTSKRVSAPLSKIHYDPVAVKERPERIVEVGNTQVMLRPKKASDAPRSTGVDTIQGESPAKDDVLDDDAEWAQIADIMASFGGGIARESVFLRDFGDSVKEFLSGGKVIQSVGDWLDDIGLPQYENTFVANGFDDIDFLGSNVLDETDLITIGVTNVQHRKSILLAAQSKPPVIPIDDDNMPSSVEEWLQSLRLSDYKDSFLGSHYTSMERVRKIWELELNVLDITVLGHKKRILASLGNRLGSERVQSFHSSDSLDWSCSPLTAVTKSSEEESLASSTEKDLDLFKDYSGVKPKYDASSQMHQKSPTENEKLKFPSIPGKKEPSRPPGDGVESDFLRIRPPQLTAMQSPIKQWRHKPEVLIKGCCNYSSQYLGSCLVSSLQGTDSTKEGIRKMKKSVQNVSKFPQIMLSISYRGVKFIDAKSRHVVSEHEVSNIFCACQDGTDMNFFAYITKDLQTNKLYCHVFKVKTMELAAEIILTLGEAFEVAYQVALKEKAAASALEFERKLSESGASSSGTGTL